MPAPRSTAIRTTLTVACLLAVATNATAQDVRFNRDVRPILAENCFPCHGPDASRRKAKLRLDVAGWSAEPGELLRRITTDDADDHMPPAKSHKELSGEQIATLRRWLEQGAAYEPHWSFVPPMDAPPPAVRDADWCNGFVDRWILARLEREGLAPSPEADRVTLLRRLYFDLVGLPPAPADVEAFVADTSTDAYERQVDQLLASPHYGERMAMYWLDLVRYADTVGYHGDQEQPIAPYRDWVIDAFNADLPFDRFTTEQLAGDLLPEPTTAQQVATGYNRVLQTTHEGGAQAQEYLTIYAADRVRNFGAVWLGATLGCCQCHDHKFDPYTARDFYSMAAFFADIEERGDFKGSPNTSPTTRPPEMVVDGRRTMITRATTPRTTRILPRGDWLDDSGDVVEPAPPHCLPPLDCGDRRATRLDLARWLVRPDHPLTARVVVNRLWYLFFGKGLSARLDDLGAQGEWPVHAELLDALALEFVRSGWSLKHMVRTIVTSNAYRQSSAITPALRERDPDNRLLARQSRWRLPAETVRDTALAVSDLLVRDVGGDSVKPYQPAGYYANLNFPKREYQAHTDRRQWRRGVYVHWQRQFLHPALLAFDAPTREECTAERTRSNTPQAALTLLDDPTFVEAARVFAASVLAAADDDDARLDLAFRRALSRLPHEDERPPLFDLLHKHRDQFAERPQDAARLLGVGLTAAPEDLAPDELAAWTSVLRVVLNLNETYTRN